MSKKLNILRTYAATLQVVGCVNNAPYRTGRVENAPAAFHPRKAMAPSKESCVSPMRYQSLSSNLQTLVADALSPHKPSKLKKQTAKKTILLFVLFAFDSCAVQGASAFLTNLLPLRNAGAAFPKGEPVSIPALTVSQLLSFGGGLSCQSPTGDERAARFSL